MEIRTAFDNKPTPAFPFAEYALRILSCLPADDLDGLESLTFVERFPHPQSDHRAIGQYYPNAGGPASIEINAVKLMEHVIPPFLLDRHFEIAGLMLSRVISHEVGHHVHTCRRAAPSIEDPEDFADAYAEAGYLAYLRTHRYKVLMGYRAAGVILLHDREQRQTLEQLIGGAMHWLEEYDGEIRFP